MMNVDGDGVGGMMMSSTSTDESFRLDAPHHDIIAHILQVDLTGKQQQQQQSSSSSSSSRAISFHPRDFCAQYMALHHCSVRLTVDVADVLMAEAILRPNAIAYVFECFDRSVTAMALAYAENDDDKRNTLVHMHELAINYTALLLRRRDIFAEDGVPQLARFLMNTETTRGTMVVHFLRRVFKHLHDTDTNTNGDGGDGGNNGITTAHDDDDDDEKTGHFSNLSTTATGIDGTGGGGEYSMEWIAGALFKDLGESMRMMNFLKDDHLAPIVALRYVLGVPELAERFIGSRDYVHELYNGFRFETNTRFSPFFRLTVLPDEPAVGQRFFPHPLSMNDVEKRYCMQMLQGKVTASRDAVVECCRHLRDGTPLALAGLLTWLASALMSNWSRARMRSERQMTSSDSFLFNMAAVLLRLWRDEVPDVSSKRLDLLDLVYCAMPIARLELADETRLGCTTADITAWLNGTDGDAEAKEDDDEKMTSPPPPPRRPPPPSLPVASEQERDVDRRLLLSLTEGGHVGIVCDKCRRRRMTGARFKCVNCKDYDLCHECEASDYRESLGLESKTGVTFKCPYPDCGSCDLTEAELRRHIAAEHIDARDLVKCPVCLANGTARLLSQANVVEHLQILHSDVHDKRGHVMLKLDRVVPVGRGRTFVHQPPFPIDCSSGDVLPPSASPDEAKYAAEMHQASVRHAHRVCAHCGQTPIQGIRFTCYQCPSYHLCQECHINGMHGHDLAHVFIQFRRPVIIEAETETETETEAAAAASTHDTKAMPCVYPGVILGSHGFNRLTEFMFITLHCMHIGLHRTCMRYMSLVAAVDTETDAAKQESLTMIKMCVDVHVLNASFLADALFLYICLTRRMATALCGGGGGGGDDDDDSNIDNNNNNNNNNLRCDFDVLPEVVPMEVACLPEYVVENLCDFLIFLSRARVVTLVEQLEGVQDILRLLTVLMAHGKYVKNPYLRAKVVDVLCALAPFPTVHSKGCDELLDFFTNDPVMVRYTTPALLRLHGDIEHMSGGSSFYEKFNVRHGIAVLLEYLRGMQHTHHAVMCRALSEGDTLKLLNSIINDMIFLLDESLTRARSACELHKLRSDTTSFIALGQAAMKEHQRAFFEACRHLRTGSVLAGQCVKLFSDVCRMDVVRATVLRPEMVERVATSINFYMKSMAGDARADIVVPNAVSYSFEPDHWVDMLSDVCVVFADDTLYLKAVVSDERSFDTAVLDDVVRMLGGVYDDERLRCAHPRAYADDKVVRMTGFVARCREEMVRLEQWNDDVGDDVPSEFMDPILCTIMTNPVVLPTSGQIMDRAVIMRHLLSDPKDPFNRQPLTAEQLTPDNELRLRIESFIAGRLQQRRAHVADAAATTAADATDTVDSWCDDVEMATTTTTATIYPSSALSNDRPNDDDNDEEG